MKVKKRNPVTPDDLWALYNVFREKDWCIEDAESKYGKAYGSLAKLLEILNEDERQLLYSLLSRFIWIDEGEYADKLANKLIENESLFKDEKVVTFIPLTKRGSETKSGESAHYSLKAKKRDLIDHTIYLGKAKLEFPSRDSLGKQLSKVGAFFFELGTCFLRFLGIPKSSPAYININDTALVFVDDFIGSGETAIEVLDEFLDENKDLSYNDIHILVICCHSIGLSKLQKKGINVLYCDLIEKGISSYYEDPNEKDRMLELAKGIGRKLPGVRKPYYLGRGECEALVALQRVPNNTLPMFWRKPPRKNNERYVPAPFGSAR
jgi:hypothetical protein